MVFVSDSVDSILGTAIQYLDFEMNNLTLKANMRKDFGFCFSFEMNATLNGTIHSWKHGEAEICLDQIIEQIVKTVLGKDSRLIQFLNFVARQDDFEGKSIAVAEAKKSLDESERSTKEEVKMETANKLAQATYKKDLLPNQQIFKFINKMKMKHYDKYSEEELKYLNRPNKMKPYNIKGEHMVKAFNHHSPWVLSKKNFESKPNYIPTMTSDAYAVKKSLVFGSSLKPCERMKRALHSYATVTSGLIRTVGKMKQVKQRSKIQRRNDMNNLAALFMKTHDLGTKYKIQQLFASPKKRYILLV